MPNTDTQAAGAPHTEDLTHTETVMPANWPEICDDFARAHHCKPVRVLTLLTDAASRGETADAQEIAADLPLSNVAAVAAMPLPNIDIRVCDSDERTIQRVERPKTLAVEKAADGRVLGLRIDDADGVTTLVQVCGSLPPGAPNGSFAAKA